MKWCAALRDKQIINCMLSSVVGDWGSCKNSNHEGFLQYNVVIESRFLTKIFKVSYKKWFMLSSAKISWQTDLPTCDQKPWKVENSQRKRTNGGFPFPHQKPTLANTAGANLGIFPQREGFVLLTKFACVCISVCVWVCGRLFSLRCKGFFTRGRWEI